MSRPALSSSLFESLEARRLMSFDRSTISEVYGIDDFIYDFSQVSTDPAQSYGSVLAGLGDINGDGFDDFAVARPELGWVDVFSGKDRGVIRELHIAGVTGFGAVLTNLGDVTGDSVPDLAVGAPRFDADADATVDRHGGLWVYSGADGALFHQITGVGDNDALGSAIIGAVDMNDDGVLDMIVGAPGAGPSGEGQVYVYSGFDWSVLRTLSGGAAGDRFGQTLAARDVPTTLVGTAGDGAVEIAVGAPGADVSGASGVDQGRVYVYDGATFAERYTLDGPEENGAFGSTIGFARGRDHQLLLVGSLLPTLLPNVFGSTVRFYSAGTGAPTGATLDGGFTLDVAQFSIMSGVRYSDRDFIILSKSSGVELYDATETGGERLAFLDEEAMAGKVGPVTVAAGDVNGDGFIDILTGSLTTTGRVTVWSGFSARQGLRLNEGDVIPFYAITDITDDGRGLWSTPDVDQGEVLTGEEVLGLVIYNGQARPFSAVPGLGRAVVLSMNNDGVIAGADLVASGTGTDKLGDRFVLRDGVKTYLKDMITSVTGTATAPDLSSISGLKIGNGGHVIFNTVVGSGFGAWVLEDGLAAFLWDGLTVDINTRGTVVGVRFHTGEIGVTMLAFPAGQLVPIADFFNPGAINDHDVVVGQFGNSIAIWDGQILILPPPSLPPTPPSGPLPEIETLDFHAHDIDNNGRITGSFSATAVGGGSLPSGEVVWQPGDGTKYVVHLLSFENSVPVFVTDQGWIFNFRTIAVPQVVEGLAADSPLVSIAGPQGSVAIGITERGQGYVTEALTATRFNQILWTGAGQGDVGPRLTDIDAYVDPHDGFVYVIGITEDGQTFWWQLDSTFRFAFRQAIGSGTADATIVSGMTVLTGRDGAVRVAGLNAAGDVVMIFQNGLADPGSPSNWSEANLSRDHLEAQGLASPVFVGDLTSFVAPWNGLNIAGLDAAGHIWTVWWAPGLTLWRSEDLSVSAGTPALTGNVAGYSTSWGGLNVAGTDADGHVVAAWWAPGLTSWRTDGLGGAVLTPGSNSSYVTPWGGLNVAGLDENGTVAVAWWAPGLVEWQFQNIDDFGRQGAAVVGHVMVSGTATAAGSIELFYRSAEDDAMRPWLKPGHLVRVFLDPELQVWMAEDVTTFAGG